MPYRRKSATGGSGGITRMTPRLERPVPISRCLDFNLAKLSLTVFGVALFDIPFLWRGLVLSTA
jgi:hypothetical protein